MRTLIFAFLLALLVGPASAQDWGHYDNDRYGYSVAIPPDFLGQGESDNGDGQEFQHRRGAQRLTIWGGLLGVGNESFEAEVKWHMEQDEAGTWNVTYQAVTPEWASFSAIKGSRILYQRMILLCDRQSYAAFRLEHSARDIARMNGVVDKLVGSLQSVC
ncbi:MAG: hypothetical protein JWR51_1917 [Devosia sp.]|uniref:hypothetical protein n=1 Tax=Devosia sp. TaxID=1871048 RepID=UPI002628F416|nr:hypothetical protein [Devosia sp.]MDB5528814.1 hypothetical protein [Devosia sp.]